MTTASELLVGASGGARFLTDPRDFHRYAPSSGLFFYNKAADNWGLSYPGSFGNAGVPAQFWAHYEALGGAVVKTAWLADTWKTILDVPTGRGFLYNVYGSRNNVGGDPNLVYGSSLRITVDGFPYTIETSLGTGEFPFLGALLPAPVGTVTVDTVRQASEVNLFGWGNNATPVMRANGFLKNNADGTLPSRNKCEEVGQVLKFNQSIKVEMKQQTALTTADTQNLTHYAGAMYRLAN
ncbi:MAG TPA: hypothetical protein VIL30_04460 [Ramlibacter sp.]|jgi:hypothetical protein